LKTTAVTTVGLLNVAEQFQQN